MCSFHCVVFIYFHISLLCVPSYVYSSWVCICEYVLRVDVYAYICFHMQYVMLCIQRKKHVNNIYIYIYIYICVCVYVYIYIYVCSVSLAQSVFSCALMSVAQPGSAIDPDCTSMMHHLHDCVTGSRTVSYTIGMILAQSRSLPVAQSRMSWFTLAQSDPSALRDCAIVRIATLPVVCKPDLVDCQWCNWVQLHVQIAPLARLCHRHPIATLCNWLSMSQYCQWHNREVRSTRLHVSIASLIWWCQYQSECHWRNWIVSAAIIIAVSDTFLARLDCKWRNMARLHFPIASWAGLYHW